MIQILCKIINQHMTKKIIVVLFKKLLKKVL